MLEILILVRIYKSLAEMAQKKGRAGTWGLLGVLFWIVGEVLGVVIGMEMDIGAAAYGIALGCAVVGVLIAYFIVKNLDGLPELDRAGDPGGGVGRFDMRNPYSPPGTRDKE